MTEKNQIFMGMNGREIEILITTTSDQQAKKLYEAIELLLTNLFDLDSETLKDERNSEDGDRHADSSHPLPGSSQEVYKRMWNDGDRPDSN